MLPSFAAFFSNRWHFHNFLRHLQISYVTKLPFPPPLICNKPHVDTWKIARYRVNRSCINEKNHPVYTSLKLLSSLSFPVFFYSHFNRNLSVILHLGSSWPHPVRNLTTSWTHSGHILATPWPQPGHILATSLPHYSHILCISWPSPGYIMVTPCSYHDHIMATP